MLDRKRKMEAPRNTLAWTLETVQLFFFVFLAAGPWPWFPTLLSISLINLQPFSEAKALSILSETNFQPFFLELPKKCRRGEDKGGRPTSWLMQRRIFCSTHLCLSVIDHVFQENSSAANSRQLLLISD